MGWHTMGGLKLQNKTAIGISNFRSAAYREPVDVESVDLDSRSGSTVYAQNLALKQTLSPFPILQIQTRDRNH